MPIGAIIGAGTSIAGGLIQRSAANKAAKQQAEAAAKAGQLLTDTGERAATGVIDAGMLGSDRLSTVQGDLDPYTEAGAKATGQVTEATSAPAAQFNFDPSTLGMDPGYQFRLAEAEKTAKQNAAAGGSLASGGFFKALSDRASQEASQETDKVFGRQLQTFQTNQGSSQDRINNLLNVMGIGTKATDQRIGLVNDMNNSEFRGELAGGNFRTDAARGTADAITGAGVAQSAGTVGGANAITGMLGNLAKTASGLDFGTVFKKAAAPVLPILRGTNPALQPGMLGAYGS